MGPYSNHNVYRFLHACSPDLCVCKFLCKILHILKIKFQAAWAAWNKITQARGPKKCGVQETNVPDTSNSSYGTVTGRDGHYRCLAATPSI